MESQSFEIPLQRISDAVTEEQGVNLYVLRTDLNHPHISGNKVYKLKYNLQEARRQGKSTLLTFGGAFSNHIAATAAAGQEQGFASIGIIRGEQPAVLSPTLQFAKACGMQLYFVSRKLYRQKADADFLHYFAATAPGIPLYDCYIIPEGGSNALGIKGCREITAGISIPFDYVCCPCGTGTTLAGIVLSLTEQEQAIGFQVLKGVGYIAAEVQEQLRLFNAARSNWTVKEDYHFGGYAKHRPELLQFMQDFEKEHAVPLDFVYTAKMMFGIYELIRSGYFEKGKTIVAIHTGGLQGNAGLKQ